MILSRYFNKPDYGTYKQVMYVYNTLLTVFTLGLPRAYSYFLPRVPLNQSRQLIKKISTIFIVLGLVFSLFLFSFAGVIAKVLNNEDLTIALRIFSVVPTLLLPTMGLEGILATYKKSMYMAFYTIATRIVMLISVIVPVCFFHGGYVEAIIGFVFSSFISFALASYLKYLPIKNEDKEKCSVTIKEIFNFSIPLLTASIWGVIITSADQFFVSRYFGSEVFADFSNGNMDMPFIGMIIGATSTVLSPIFSKMSNDNVDPKKQILPLWQSVFEKSAKIVFPLVLYCMVFADLIMVFLYGQQYELSKNYFRIRLITNFFTIIAFAPLLINVGKVRFYSNVQLIGAIILVLLEFLSVKLFSSPYLISWISTLCTIGRIVVMLIAIARMFSFNIKELIPFGLMMKLLIPPTIMLLAIRFLLENINTFNALVMLIISAAIYGVLFLLYSYVVKLDYVSILKSLRK